MILPEEERRSAQMAISAIVGLPLSTMYRPFCQKFEFGEQKPYVTRRGRETTAADWALAANCRWRIDGPGGFCLTSEHFVPERRDEHAYPFYESLETDPPIVESVSVESDGGLRIAMTGGYSLALYTAVYDEEDGYDWRFMPPEDDPRGHLVFGWCAFGWEGGDTPPQSS